MKKILRVLGWTMLGFLILGCGLAIAASVLSDKKLLRTVDLPVALIAVADDDAAKSRGKYLYDSRGCMECHGADGGGKIVLNDPSGFFVRSPNITRGRGSPVEHYGVADWVRTVRHGVKPSGHPMLVMPCEDYNQMTDEDLGSLIAYLSTLPGKPGGGAQMRIPLIVRALYVTGGVQDAYEKIDHTRAPPTSAQAASEHGAYVANMCRGCHGNGFSGGKIPGAPPSWPAAANLTGSADGALSRYDVRSFTAMMRTGKRPDGSEVSAVMPFASFKNVDDGELEVLFGYLKTLPSRTTGTR